MKIESINDTIDLRFEVKNNSLSVSIKDDKLILTEDKVKYFKLLLNQADKIEEISKIGKVLNSKSV